MELYYCLGGGFGHITRFLAFKYTFGVNPDLITACKALQDGFPALDDTRLHVPEEYDISSPEAFRGWITMLIDNLRPARFYIDTFPGGILGELTDLDALENVKLVYLARHIKWNKYLERINGKFPDFEEILILEELQPEHQVFINMSSARKLETELIDPDVPCISDLPENFWLVIHSDPGEELKNLWHYACETAEIEKVKPAFIVVSAGKKPEFLPNDVLFINAYPAHGMFHKAEKVFSGAGFNMVRQMKKYRKKHHVLPFERALDDQFFRASLLWNNNSQLASHSIRQF
ncbi:MAG: hypothetical protein Kow0029_11820 [Candidatus Rifleibacteriota bacterium]